MDFLVAILRRLSRENVAGTRPETINLRATLVPRLTPRKYENAIAGAVETRVRSSTYSLASTHLLGNSKGQAESGSASVEAPT